MTESVNMLGMVSVYIYVKHFEIIHLPMDNVEGGSMGVFLIPSVSDFDHWSQVSDIEGHK